MRDISSFGILSHALTRNSSRGEVLRLLEITDSEFKLGVGVAILFTRHSAGTFQVNKQ